MKESSIEKIPYDLPESKEDITLGQWIKYLPFDNEEVDVDLRISKMIEIFCGVPTRKIGQLEKWRIDEIMVNMNKIFSAPNKHVTNFWHEGVHYGMITDFDEEITADELRDLDKYFREKEYARFLSILYRPMKKFDKLTGLYQIEPYSGTHELFLTLRYDIYESSVVFFWTTSQELLNRSLSFIGNQIEEIVKMNGMEMKTYQQQVNLLKDGIRIWN